MMFRDGAALVAWAGVPLAVGWWLIGAVTGRGKGLRPLIPFAMITGLGTMALSYFAWSLAGLPTDWRYLVCELGIGSVCAIAAWRRRAIGTRTVSNPDSERDLAVIGRNVYPLLTVLLLVCGVALFVACCRIYPYGNWDAWGIWNLKAKFLSAGALHEMFVAPMNISHLEYPLLVPATVARGWTALGSTGQTVPIATALCFGGATIWLLFTALSQVQGRVAATLAVGTLLAAGFPLYAASQYADVPFGCYLLASFVLLTDGPPQGTLWAGACAGLAAWTKNEGLMLSAMMMLVLAGMALAGRRRWPDVGRFIAGAALPLAVCAGFKFWAGASNDLLAGQAFPILRTRLFDIHRHGLIWQFLIREIMALGGWPVPMVAVLALFAVTTGWARRALDRALPAIASFCGQALGYYLIYLITPRPLAWHLDTSLRRLVIQMLPAALYLLFVTLRTETTIAALAAGPAAPPVQGRS